MEIVYLIVASVLPVIFLSIIGYLYISEKDKNRKIMEKINKLDLKPIEKEVLKIHEDENKYFAKIFEQEMLLENYRKAALIIGEKMEDLEKKINEIENLPKDYEMTYRDVVRKVLEMDNKFTGKFNMLGEALLKLKEEFDEKNK